MSTSILIVGAGNMGGALARGLVNKGYHKSSTVAVHDKHTERLEALCAGHGVKAVTTLAGDMNYDAIVLCVKPQDLVTVANEVKGRLSPKALIVSVLAGKKMARVAEVFAHKGAVVRAMPNIAATVLCAATAMCANAETNDAHRQLAEDLFGAVGEAYWTKESLMDTVTGLSGSGPAYIYMVIEALTDGGVKMGLPRDLAMKLATQTVLGAATLVKASGMHPAILKDQVSTPAGTTISALHKLEQLGLRSMFVSAVEIATERSVDLGSKD